MKERPILFNAEMVRVILDGRKTQTRRVVKWQGPKGYPHSFEHAKRESLAGTKCLMVPYNHPSNPELDWWEHGAHRHYCPYGVPGDRLWVRETWRGLKEYDHLKPSEIPKGSPVQYVSTGSNAPFPCEILPDSRFGKIRPSIFMCDWMSGINLKITDIRVERVQDISEEDAKAEGIERVGDMHFKNYIQSMENIGDYGSPIMSFRSLWNSINEKRGYGWDANPWVWVVEFVDQKSIGA